ncbi:MAG: hypothetical protein LBB91_02315 [Clostridiales bacterium]|jgi:prefoldin subunit 5|nr:hypothetical protein [Clostridiales bacterium]
MSLSSLETALGNKRLQLQQKQAEKQGYLDTAAEIERIYQRMSEDKRIMKEHKSNIRTFSEAEYLDFKGDLFQNKYEPKLFELLSSYDEVIYNLSYNMEELSMKIAAFNNMAYNCDAAIGLLNSAINSLIQQVGI